MTLASMFTVSDWCGMAGFAAAQTLVLGTLVWRLASRLQTIESKVDMLVATEIANMKSRLDRAGI